jgi:hypothetical protein
MAKQLVVYLVGRICVVTKGANTWAVFLNARHNPKLGLRTHTPLLSVPLSMVASQTTADRAHLTGGTFVDRAVGKGPLIDSMGMWFLSGHDMTIQGVKQGVGNQQIGDLADLNAIIATIDPAGKHTFEPGILNKNPQQFGVSARLLLPKAADVTAVTESTHKRTFMPGGHTQKIATYVKCEMPFADDLHAPTLTLRAFSGGRRVVYKLACQGYSQVKLMMSNLCNCVKEPYTNGSVGKIDDREFVLYYELLRRPRPGQRPLPEIKVKLGGADVPECYDPARLALGTGSHDKRF